jgi:hypothetical protein
MQPKIALKINDDAEMVSGLQGGPPTGSDAGLSNSVLAVGHPGSDA